MKSRLAVVLSLSGVLVAGSAAAYVNTQVLDNGDGAAAEAAPAVALVPTTVPGTVVATLPSATVPAQPAPAAAPADGGVASNNGLVPSGVPAATQATYAIGAAGSVTLDRAGGQLQIVSAVPSSGWTVTMAENEGPLAIKVTLRSSTIQVDFRANLLYDIVSTSVESTDLTAPVAGGSPGGGTGYSDDDDGEYEDEYEDDEDEYEDHDDEDEGDDHEEEGDDD